MTGAVVCTGNDVFHYQAFPSIFVMRTHHWCNNTGPHYSYHAASLLLSKDQGGFTSDYDFLFVCLLAEWQGSIIQSKHFYVTEGGGKVRLVSQEIKLSIISWISEHSRASENLFLSKPSPWLPHSRIMNLTLDSPTRVGLLCLWMVCRKEEDTDLRTQVSQEREVQTPDPAQPPQPHLLRVFTHLSLQDHLGGTTPVPCRFSSTGILPDRASLGTGLIRRTFACRHKWEGPGVKSSTEIGNAQMTGRTPKAGIRKIDNDRVSEWVSPK